MSMHDDVKEFHRFFGHSIGKRPKFLDPERMKNRMKWQDEERQEFLDAVAANDIVEAADAIADQIYFIIGTAVEMGIPLSHVWESVHTANMTKAHYFRHSEDCPLNSENEVPIRCTCGAVQYKDDGKTAKPEGWKEPQDTIRFLLAR